ncbi:MULTISPECIES: OmpP1/FadL family transporter [Legionella]|uniref:Outer membrane protein n=1 Tax=Legionella maceachernii TaxID=466 RepID=A0A0W0WD14_9GAMM|nr:outer membrane protein transport protein [Legionella maceachernii]KTD30247.1 outer membrane protein [Legionella maceachernii]SJZ51418.1 long-chain fatty acid transport protein [Legionella maceachernii]SUP03683.1 Outer membrane protein transport protein (OMPP1/FadL/TodX) [Legionella maceachernii]
MQVIFLKLLIAIFLCLSLECLWEPAYCAVDQILTDNFFQNPAELSSVNHAQLLLGNALILPRLKFTGTTVLGHGRVKSKTHDSLPYLLTAYRLTDRWVVGINATPSAYGHIDWQPHNSIVSQASTTTRIFYYRIGAQSSYQVTKKLAVGMGLNLEYNKFAELNFVVPNAGNQINRIHGLNYTGDIGLFYKIHSHTYLTMAIYTGINTYGHGTSSTEAITVHNFSLNIIQAPVAFAGLQHWLTEKWFIGGKVYWSGWSIEKNVNLINKTTGTSISPARWRDGWSFQMNTRYRISDVLALLSSTLYETNVAPISTNAIGYPLSAFGAVAGGIDFSVQKNLSFQFVYSYGKFIPNAKIDSAGNRGVISVCSQAALIQFTYKI